MAITKRALKSEKKVKKFSSRSRSVNLPIELPPEQPADLAPSAEAQMVNKKFNLKSVALVFVLSGLAVIFWLRRGWFVAAMVNGRPILRTQLNQMMLKRFGEQTLETMIGERVIMDAAKAARVAIDAKELEAKKSEIVKKIGGETTFTNMLQFQGLTADEFFDQLRLQLLIEKLLGKEIQISESDIDNFIASNRAQMVATVAADLRGEAREALFSQKLNQKLQSWFADLRQKAKVWKFL